MLSLWNFLQKHTSHKTAEEREEFEEDFDDVTEEDGGDEFEDDF